MFQTTNQFFFVKVWNLTFSTSGNHGEIIPISWEINPIVIGYPENLWDEKNAIVTRLCQLIMA